MSRCRSCEAEIHWATTPAGKSMPLDAEPSPAGEWALVNGRTWRATEQDRKLHRPLYTVHWATCPSPDEHRWRS